MSNIFSLCLIAYTFHMLEEYQHNWLYWAQDQLLLPVDWSDFYITNLAVIVCGLCAIAISWELPYISLTLPSFMFINGLFFHMIPTFRSSIWSPGTGTATVLFMPLYFHALTEARKRGVSFLSILSSLGLAMIIMAFPIVLVLTRDKIGYSRPAADLATFINNY
jgi:hypothetical membrane protein